ncbi:phosphomannomutase/phosphoglucomutase, partial [Patescibacteria group bacterium]|nr:phosphomannomutase/phosphoglucomutase [Patescibacteria group bacterium]
EEIERLGGKPLMTRVGHAFIKKQLSDSKGAGAAELSSHFYFKDFYGVECSDLMFLYLLLIVSGENKPLSQIIAPFKKYLQSGEINFQVKNKNKKIAEIKKRYEKKTKHFTDIDGIRMEFEEDSGLWWWFSVRASNTEPLLRLNIETNNGKLLEEKLAEVKRIIEK